MNEYFIENYLTSGYARDNMVFEKCPADLLALAEIRLKNDNNGVVSSVVTFNDYECAKVEDSMSKLRTKYQRDIVARDYIVNRVMESILCKIDSREGAGYSLKQIRDMQEDLYSGETKRLSNFISLSPMPSDLDCLIGKVGKVEINFILDNFKSVDLQKAINNLLSARTPYSVRVFTSAKNLSTYYDQLGNLIQSPHDYLNINISKFMNNGKNGSAMQNE